MTLLQVALDYDDEKKAVSTAKKVSNYVDIIEVGTPLIKAANEEKIIKNIKKFKKKVFADLKTMDTGYFEAKHAFKAGADYVSVLGVASDGTVKGAIEAAGKKETVVDLVGCKNITKRIKELKKVGANNFEIHTGIDEQIAGKNPFNQMKAASKIKDIKTWVAGGIKKESLSKIMKYKPDVVVVGGAITKARYPEKAAKELKALLEEME